MTPLWANSTTVRRPLDKMKPKDCLDNFSFYLFYYFLFFLRTQVARNKTSGYTVTKYPPVTPLWANSTTVRRTLGQNEAKDWFRHFFLSYFKFIIFFFLRTQIARNKTSGYMVTKYPPVTPLRANSTTVRRTLGQNEAKGLVKRNNFSCFILCSDSSCNFEQDIWLSWL